MSNYSFIVLLAVLAGCMAQFELETRYRQPHEVITTLRRMEAISSRTSEIDWETIERILENLSPAKLLKDRAAIEAVNISQACGDQLLFMMDSLEGGYLDDRWAWDMLDAWGKPDAGIRRLSLSWLGNFEECRSVHSNISVVVPEDQVNPVEFDGQYCTVGVNVSLLTATFMSEVGIAIGGCFPSGCSNHDIRNLTDFVVGQNKTFEINCQEKEMKLSTPAIAAIVMYSIMAGICLLGTFYEFMFIVSAPTAAPKLSPSKDDSPSTSDGDGGDDVEVLIPASEESEPVERKPGALGSFLMCFSLYSNGCQVLSTKQPPGSLTCIHGIRFISMLWVILGHTFVFSLNTAKNSLALFGWFKRWHFQAVLNAPVSVDSFFALSGVLGTFVLLRDMSRKNPGIKRFLISVPVAYLHRYIRLTPAYGFMLFFYATLTLYMYNSPFKPTGTDTADEFCYNWWENLLYVSNIIHPLKMCAPWTWYLSNDFQFFLVVPFVVYLMHRLPKVGFALSILMVLASACAATGISAHYNLGVSMFTSRDPAHPDLTVLANDAKHFYYAPWVRYQSFGVGVTFGFILWHLKGRMPIPRFANLLLWAVSAVLMLAVLYGPFHLEDSTRVASVAEASIYNGWSKVAWSLGLCYVILACCTDSGGWVNEFLSWPGFIPVSKMTYCAYLLHPIVIIIVSASHMEKVIWTEITSAYMFVAYAGLSFGVAFIFSLVFEMPFAHLDKNYITGNLKKRS